MNATARPPVPFENWTITKPARRGRKGVVVAQEAEAAGIGADMFESGGNAVDAAIATALALSVTEPWMSGLGGGGFMVAYIASEHAVKVIDFGMVAPGQLDPSDFPLTGSQGAEMFGWPQVKDDANIHGPKSIAVPGAVAGYGLAAATFGRKPWSDLVDPAIELAERGHRVTWWTTLQVAAEAGLLARYPASKGVWLPGGFPPSMLPETATSFLSMQGFAQSLRVLADEGPRSLYEGTLARSVAADVSASGGFLSEADLAGYSARLTEPLQLTRGEAVYHLPRGLTAGPTFAQALLQLPDLDSRQPDAVTYSAYAKALVDAYRARLENMGHAGDDGTQSCTTHISAADADGNLVMLTSTLLSPFGSRMVLPSSGILMNNGINWFDPRPGKPNSLASGKRPLSNMCPMVATRNGAPWFGYGASGGRKIMPAVFQLASFTNDFGMDLETALAHPRLDASDIHTLVHDGRLDTAVAAAINAVAPSTAWGPTTFPSMYANPSGVAITVDGECLGAVHPYSPVSGVAAA